MARSWKLGRVGGGISRRIEKGLGPASFRSSDRSARFPTPSQCFSFLRGCHCGCEVLRHACRGNVVPVHEHTYRPKGFGTGKKISIYTLPDLKATHAKKAPLAFFFFRNSNTRGKQLVGLTDGTFHEVSQSLRRTWEHAQCDAAPSCLGDAVCPPVLKLSNVARSAPFKLCTASGISDR